VANIDPQLLAASLRQLGAVAGHDISSAVDEAVHACVALFGVTGSGLMIADEQSDLHYVASSDGPSHVLEETQSEYGEGPCVEAFVHNRVITVNDVGADVRWPSIRGTLVDHGVVAVLGCPLRLGGVPVGSIDVYCDEPHDWDDSERAALSRYSDVVEATLTAAMAAHRAGEIAGQLQYALDYRVVIERAVGFLMAQRGLASVPAFDLLRRAARTQRRKIAEVAEELLETGKLGP
jgi:GAF domain-containing protein